MPTIHANDIDIYYELRGSSAGKPTLVLNHGWMAPSEDWRPELLDALGGSARLLISDVRGHGRTTAPEDPEAYSMPLYARDVRALLDALDIEQAHIAGISHGGMVAAQFAVDYPERTRSLLLCDSSAGNGLDEGPGGAWERSMQEGLARMEAIAQKEGMATLAERRIEFALDDEHYDEHPWAPDVRDAKERLNHERMSLHAFLGTSRAIRTRPDLTSRIAQLRVPALVVGGEWDDFFPCTERDHKLIEGSRFVRVRNCAHSSETWRPDAFIAAVTGFIEDVEAGRDVAGEVEL